MGVLIMEWKQIRETYPFQWLLIEALKAHTDENMQRILDEIAVIDMCADGPSAWKRYLAFQESEPAREVYPVYTGRETLDITERRWMGIRPKR